ncbi:Mitochondrial ribonuclease P protein 1-like protein [Dinothrombium tinctorium]|uniref:RNA (guanine-9-)-methyltransferase domain-containing protein 1 n=1 Tax=Dinothrombium tinctorium TaxID=1965070 RepID=A0A3S3P8P8_9ACAR|nr:Mitochondrial ribonuclease P protein 1-like protein [Dinothrombium tinctorium]
MSALISLFFRFFRRFKIDSQKACTSNGGERVFFNDLTVSKYKALIKSEEDRRLVESVLIDYEKVLQMTGEVTSTLTENQMVKAMSCSTFKSRKRFFRLQFEKEIKELSNERRKELRALRLNKNYSANTLQPSVGIKFDEKTGTPVYGLWKNSLFIRLPNKTLNASFKFKFFNSTFFGQNLVFDLSYEHLMKEHEYKCICLELNQVYHINKHLKNPYNLWFCNYKCGSSMHSLIKFLHPNIDESFINFHEDSYLKFFPKQNLVYLTPDASTPLMTYDHDAVYIVGAFADTVYQKGVSLSKAEKDGIKLARLPINEYCPLYGTKNVLTVPQMMLILKTAKETSSDWREAFKYIPKRRIKKEEINTRNYETSEEGDDCENSDLCNKASV